MFSTLLLSCFKCLNKFEIVVWDICFLVPICDTYRGQKLIPIGGNFKGESHQADSFSPSCEQKHTTLHSSQKQFSNFEDFKVFFVLLIWDILDIASERDAIGGDFKWKSYQVE